MPRALVVHADEVGRNLMRCALERCGIPTLARSSVTEVRDVPWRTIDVVAVDGHHPQDGGLRLMRQLRNKRWPGTLLYTASRIPDPVLEELKVDLRVRAAFLDPLDLHEVELRLGRVVPGARAGVGRPEASLPDNWSGALRRARKAFLTDLTVWTRALEEALSRARNEGDPQALDEAAQVAGNFADEAARLHVPIVAACARAIAARAAALRAGTLAAGDPTPWQEIDTLGVVIVAAVPDADQAGATINTGQLEAFDRRVLVLSEDLDLLVEAAAAATEANVGLMSARDAAEVVRVASHRPLDAVLVDAAMPEAAWTSSVTWLRRQPGRHDLPLALVAPADDVEDTRRRAAARVLGARAVLPRPLRAADVTQLLQTTHGARRVRGARVLVLDEHGAVTEQLRALLAPQGVEIVHRSDAADVEELVARHQPDALVVDVMLPVVSGFDAARRVRATEAGAALPLLFVATQPSAALRTACFRAGGEACLALPVSDEELSARVLGALERHRSAQGVDPVSGAATRAALLEATHEALAEGEDDVAVGLVDIDFFHEVNAGFGYDAADAVLHDLADHLRRAAGDAATVGRWGDDQLGVVVRGATRSGVLTLLQQAATALAATHFEAGVGRRFQVSAQVAAASSHRTGRRAAALWRAADAGMQAVKDARG